MFIEGRTGTGKMLAKNSRWGGAEVMEMVHDRDGIGGVHFMKTPSTFPEGKTCLCHPSSILAQ